MARLRQASPEYGPRLEGRSEQQATLVLGGFRYPAFPRGGWDVQRRLADMDATGVDVQALSVVPFTFLYELDPAITTAFSRIQNEEIAALVRSHPSRFVGLATLPMQDPGAAARELRRAMRELGLRGFSVCTHVAGRNLDDPALEPMWATAEELGAFIFVHPQNVAAADRLGSYYLINLVGNPLDTTIAATSLVFGGVLERYPRLPFCLAHGGGFVPYQRGRFEHGWRVREEPKRPLRDAPAASLDRFYYDTILHSAPALEYLVRTAGAEHVLLGSDYPFDMGPADPVQSVLTAIGDPAQQRTILGEAAAPLLGVEGWRA